MLTFRSGLALLAVSLLVTCAGSAQISQPLKLVPIPREVTSVAVQPLSDGLQINCAAPCAPEDRFAIDDLESWLTALGVRPRRLPAWTRAQYPDQGMDDVAAQPSGVRLAFRTEATVLELGVVTSTTGEAGAEPRIASFDLVLDGRFAVRVPYAPGRVRFAGLPPTLKEAEIWLPQHTQVELTDLWADTDILPPSPADRPIWLHHGSSISHCHEADGPTGTWPAVAAGALTLQVIRELLAESDPNLHYLDGRDLYGEADYAEIPLPDELHPDPAGHRRIGENFARLAFGDSGPFTAETV